MVEESQILEERKKKVVSFLKQKQEWLYYVGLAIVVWFGAIFVRTANIDRLKDVTGGLALAPDLDPYLFLRWAQNIVDTGSLMAIDTFRAAPIGLETAGELPLVPYGIAYLYKFLSIFSSTTSVEYAAIIFPVIFFVGTLIVFFLLVRQMFNEYKYNNPIALTATAILAVIPGFVHRTVAGVPEKEAMGFFFLFLAFYFMIVAWQSGNWKKSGLFGLLAGVSTGLMGLAWGGVTFVFVVIGLSSFVYFFTENYKDRDIISYLGWIVGFTILLFPHARYGFNLMTSTTSGFAYFVLGLLIVNYVLFNTKLKEKLKVVELSEKLKVPNKALSLIILIVLGFFAVLIVSPSMFEDVSKDVSAQLIKPFEGNRFTVTVAENNRPFFNSWKNSFGNLFWIFFLGSIFLFFDSIKSLKSKNRWILGTAFFLLISGIIFTRLKPDSILNGASGMSIFLFIGSMALFGVTAAYFYFKDDKMEINAGIILALVWIFFGLISARGAIRLLYFTYPIGGIIVAYAAVRAGQKTFEAKDEVIKIIWGIIAVVFIITIFWSLYAFSGASYNEVKYGSVPSSYNVQWQHAMSWVRDNTPTDAVFAHWWDYGYWVQTIGKRATILDGGNYIVYWDHLLGRHVLTGETEKEALEFLKVHNGTHLLIDSTDIGKYTAFSSIGSDENYDRFSFIPTFNFDEAATQRRRNETLYVLSGGVNMDEDIIWKDQVFAEGVSGIGGFILPMESINGSVVGRLKQPRAVVINRGQQLQVPIKCVYLEGKIIFEEEGIDGCLYLVPRIDQNGYKSIGGGLWLSPRLMRSLFTKLFLFDEGENFKLVHTEEHPAINELNNNYELNLPSFTIVNGALLGPIKIWEIEYPEDIEIKPEYLELDYPEDRPGLWQVRR